MSSRFEAFWTHDKYAVVGHSAKCAFPKMTYEALKTKQGKTVFAVDPSGGELGGDEIYANLETLPETVDAVVLEVPKTDTRDWIEKIAQAGIGRVWIHMGRDSEAALKLAADKNIEVCSGTCAVQYVRGGFPHNVHRLLRKISGNW